LKRKERERERERKEKKKNKKAKAALGVTLPRSAHLPARPNYFALRPLSPTRAHALTQGPYLSFSHVRFLLVPLLHGTRSVSFPPNRSGRVHRSADRAAAPRDFCARPQRITWVDKVPCRRLPLLSPVPRSVHQSRPHVRRCPRRK
jgi:hypothetical protein